MRRFLKFVGKPSTRACVSIGVGLVVFTTTAASGAGFLFDASHAQMAANADWVIDADIRNIGTGTGGAMTVGQGDESNPSAVPTPAQSGITSSTPETYWSGANSAWGVDLVKRGHSVSTLPYNGAFTYGTNAAQDLSKYDVLVVNEPNILFTTAEKTALVNYVKSGGGLVMIADHNGSDRNGDGKDSIDVWNDLFTNNSVASNPFGLSFNSTSVTQTSTNVNTSATDPIIKGPVGTATALAFNAGTTITIDPTKNGTVKSAVWTNGSSTNTNAMVAYGSYGLGRFVAVGDSSPADDGTGDPNDTLFGGWFDNSDRLIFLNASEYATTNAPEPSTGTAGVAMLAAALIRRRRNTSSPHRAGSTRN